MPTALPENDAEKVFRSIATIAAICVLWPIFLAVVHSGPGIAKLPGQSLGLLLGGPVFLFALIAGFVAVTFIPALAVGCFCALISPSIEKTGQFDLSATAVGVVASLLMAIALGSVWTLESLRLVAESGLASLCSAIAVGPFRSRPIILNQGEKAQDAH